MRFTRLNRQILLGARLDEALLQEGFSNVGVADEAPCQEPFAGEVALLLQAVSELAAPEFGKGPGRAGHYQPLLVVKRVGANLL